MKNSFTKTKLPPGKFLKFSTKTIHVYINNKIKIAFFSKAHAFLHTHKKKFLYMLYLTFHVHKSSCKYGKKKFYFLINE